MSFLEIVQKSLSRLGYGGITAVIGILIVFVGLTIIIFSLVIMAKLFQAFEKRKAEKAQRAAAAEAAASAEAVPAEVQEEETESETVEDGELIAVIAAAIAAFDFDGKPVAIKSVRRVNGWKNAARNEQVFKF